MDKNVQLAPADAEARRQESERVREESERRRVAAEAARVGAEEGRRLAATEMAQTVATLTELLSRMEAVEQMRRSARRDTTD
jgi:hypothetical protein